LLKIKVNIFITIIALKKLIDSNIIDVRIKHIRIKSITSFSLDKLEKQSENNP
jgi:hypothetical protein